MAYNVLHQILIFIVYCFQFCHGYLPSSQIDALTDLYESLNGEQWQFPSTDVAQWNCKWNFTLLRFNETLPSIYCGLWLEPLTSCTQTVVRLNFTDVDNLIGTLPASIGQLVDLQVIRFWNDKDNNVSGTIPNSICNLTDLYYLEIFKQNSYGRVPQCIGNLNLTHFRLVNAYHRVTSAAIAWSINPSIIEAFCQNSKNMTTLSLRGMIYDGSIPECIGTDLIHLEHLSFYDLEKFNTSIPESIGTLQNLTYFEVTDCPNVYGTLPPNILRHYKLEYLYIQNTSLSGSISTTDLCNNTMLKGLNIGSDIHFEMPTCIHKLTELIDLGFEGKNVNGSIPKEICALKKLKFLYLANTSMVGSIPKCIGTNLTNLVSLDFAGPLKGKISGYDGIKKDYIGYDGEFPPLYLRELVMLKIKNNKFSGKISSIFPLPKYPNLQIVLLNNNKFTDTDIGPTLKKWFQYSPNLLGISMYKQNYIGGSFPSFEQETYLDDLSIFAAQALDINGTLPNNLHFGRNVTNFSFSIYDNRLSSYLPEDLILSTYVSNNVIQSNLFTILRPWRAPHWLSNSDFLDADQLYLTGSQLAISWSIVTVSMLCFLFVVVKKHYTFPYYLINGEYEFIQNVKEIDAHLLNYKLLGITFILLIFYPFFNKYYEETPVLSHFCLYYFSDNHLRTKMILVTLLIAYNIIALLTILNIVNGSKHQKHTTALNLNNIPMNQLQANLLEENDDNQNVSRTEMTLDDIMFAFCNIKSCQSIMNLIVWTFLFLISTSMLMLYFVTESLPDDNTLQFNFASRKTLEWSISFIITFNSAVVIPRFTASLFQMFPKCIPTKNQNIIIMLLRTVVTIIIPLFVSFLLLGDCCNGWTQFWNKCRDKDSFNISSGLTPSDYTVNDTTYKAGSTLTNRYVYSTVRLEVSSNEQVCHSHCFKTDAKYIYWSKCIRTFLFKWSKILMQKMIIMFFMPPFIILFQTIKRKVMKEEHTHIFIDSEYTMITTKLELILAFGVFCPLLYPVIIVSLNSFIYFYQLALTKLNWKITFTHYSNGPRSFPFQFLLFGVVTQQTLSFLFFVSSFDPDMQALAWVLFTAYFVIDGFVILRE